MEFLRRHRSVFGLMFVTGLLALIPVLNAYFVIGGEWRGVPQSYGDEILYYNQIKEVADGHPFYGNQYLYEHREGPTLVFFVGHWLAALPLLLGLPLVPSLVLNFIVWSIVFTALGYWLLRELGTSRIFAWLGSLLAYLSVYGLMIRPTSRQEVFPFFILFYIALVRFLKLPQERAPVLFLGIATGATFYAFSYLWQIAVTTLGLLFLWTLWRRDWTLMRGTLKASVLGGVLGAPALLYMLYLYLNVPYFLESLSRFGLVRTHLPMAEVVYSGGWIAALIVIAALAWRYRSAENSAYNRLFLFGTVAGLALWIMEGSNSVTGTLVETAEHVKPFIAPWAAFFGTALIFCLWGRKDTTRRFLIAAAILVVGLASLQSMKLYFFPYLQVAQNREAWVDQQSYAAPLQWLEQAEPAAVVIWSHPEHPITLHVPSFTKHYLLFAQPAIFTLTPDAEIRERYLVASYFDAVSPDFLKEKLPFYVGRGDAFHKAKSIERGIKLCRIFFIWKSDEECGEIPTSAGLFGDRFFEDMASRFSDDIRPNIMSYLKKYHVAYVLKDTRLNPQMKPETLGAVKVWNDARYEIYKLP